MNFGLIGCGRHGSRYAGHLLAGDVPGARLVAVSRRDEEKGRRFASETGVRFHLDADSLAEDPSVEAVVVCLPPDLHAEAALAVLRAGRALLVEKPLASTVEEARAI